MYLQTSIYNENLYKRPVLKNSVIINDKPETLRAKHHTLVKSCSTTQIFIELINYLLLQSAPTSIFILRLSFFLKVANEYFTLFIVKTLWSGYTRSNGEEYKAAALMLTCRLQTFRHKVTEKDLTYSFNFSLKKTKAVVHSVIRYNKNHTGDN